MMMTPVTVETVRDILASSPELAADGGVRLASELSEDDAALGIEVASTPAVGDVIVEQAGARLFLDEDAAHYMVDKTLDVDLDQGDRIRFVVVPQNGQPPMRMGV